VDTSIRTARKHRGRLFETKTTQRLFQFALYRTATRLSLRPPKRRSVVGDRQLQGRWCIDTQEINRVLRIDRHMRYETNSISTSGAASPRRTPSFDIRVYPPAISSYLGATTSNSRLTAGV